MGDLNASQADAAGGARHEHGFAGLQPRTIDQGIPGGEIAVLYCRPNNEIYIFWKTGAVRSLGGHALRKTTEPSSASDPITGAKPLSVFAAGDDNPGGVHSRYVRKRWPLLIATANHQVIGEADAGRMYVDQNLIRRGPRFSRLADAQRLDPVEAVAEYRAHVFLRDPAFRQPQLSMSFRAEPADRRQSRWHGRLQAGSPLHQTAPPRR